MSHAYVLLSGGVDSSTCLGHALEKYASVTAISMLYGQRHVKEVKHAGRVAKVMGVNAGNDVEFMIKDITQIMGVGGLTDPSLVIPNASYEELGEGVSPTYVPFRNGILLSLIAGLAAADPEAKAVYYGAHAEDAENDAYPDCSVAFMMHMRNAIEVGTYGRIYLEAPLIAMTKAEVVKLGDEYDVPWDVTWSCYEGGEHHCGVCPTCRARRDAFKDAEVRDPTFYRSATA